MQKLKKERFVEAGVYSLKKSKKEKITFTKKSASISPAYFVITKNIVVTIYFAEVILSLVVDHSEIAKKYCDFFDILWKMTSD